MSVRIVAAILAAIGLGACSLYGGLDGFSSPDDPTNVSDGSTTLDSSAPGDGDAALTGDASTSDADSAGPPGDDAGADARYCAAFANEDLCADFDDSMPLASWTKNSGGSADIALVASGARSAPSALRATAGTSGERWAYYQRTLGNAAVDHARLSYALFVEQRPASNELEVNGLRFVTTKTYEFYLAVNATDAYIVEQSSNSDGTGHLTNYHALGTSIPTGIWLQISLEVVLAGATKELVFTVDGVEITRKALTLTGPGVPHVRAGLTWVGSGTSGSSAVLVDDVRFDILP